MKREMWNDKAAMLCLLTNHRAGMLAVSQFREHMYFVACGAAELIGRWACRDVTGRIVTVIVEPEMCAQIRERIATGCSWVAVKQEIKAFISEH